MRKLLLGGGIVLILFIGLFWEQISDLAVYELPHKWNHKSFIVLTSVNQDIEEKLNNAVPRGSVSTWNEGSKMYEMHFSYSSWHDATNKKYYYRFKNNGREEICAKSTVFPLSFGQLGIKFFPGEVKYFVINNTHLPDGDRGVEWPLQIYKNCFSFAYSGGSMGLVVPK